CSIASCTPLRSLMPSCALSPESAPIKPILYVWVALPPLLLLPPRPPVGAPVFLLPPLLEQAESAKAPAALKATAVTTTRDRTAEPPVRSLPVGAVPPSLSAPVGRTLVQTSKHRNKHPDR